MAKQPFEIKPLSGAIGAELIGIDLSRPMNDATFAAFNKAWQQYKVLFFRDQELTPEQHIALGKKFGKPPELPGQVHNTAPPLDR